MDFFQYGCFIFTATWLIGGIVFFAWLNWRQFIEIINKFIAYVVAGSKAALEAALLLSIFLIPLIIIILNLIFNPH